MKHRLFFYLFIQCIYSSLAATFDTFWVVNATYVFDTFNVYNSLAFPLKCSCIYFHGHNSWLIFHSWALLSIWDLSQSSWAFKDSQGPSACLGSMGVTPQTTQVVKQTHHLPAFTYIYLLPFSPYLVDGHWVHDIHHLKVQLKYIWQIKVQVK